ncbi:hypothetical protein D3C72_1201160 [compost metagenome]
MIAASTALGFIVNDSSISTNTGIAPAAITDSKLATKVNVGIITSSPAPIPSATKAVVKAVVPLEVNWAYFTPNLS